MGQTADQFTCPDCKMAFESSEAYLRHRADQHQGDLKDAYPPTQGDSTMAQQASTPDERVVSTGQVEDEPGRTEHAERTERDVHRPPIPGRSRTDSG